MTFLGLTDSNQLAGLNPAPQGMARPINVENRWRGSDNRTDGTIGKGEDGPPPPNGEETGAGRTGLGGDVQMTPPHNYG